MAQLFQPTNITPDIRGAFGNGVVTIDGAASFLEDVCTVSWQVNGNTPMTAFKIDFTDMDGNALYSTGKLTRGCPFYGTNQSGNISLFSYNIIQDDISTSFLRRASEGLMRITQWWGNGENDFIVQLSPSHYIVRQPLVAYWTRDGGSPTTSRNASFTGSFTGAETDGLMWIRWVLESITYESGRITSRQTVKDTGRLYGSVNPVFSYDGFLPGDYWLTLSGETSAGVVSELGEDIIHVVYDLSDVGVPVTASRDCNGESAVSVSWPRLQNIPLVDGGTGVSDNGRQISLSGDDSFLKWNVVNEEAMNFSAPWSAIWCGTVSTSSYKLFEIETTTAKYTSYVTTTNNGNGVLMVNIVGVPGGPTIQPQTLLYFTNWVDGPFMCIITPTTVYWKCMAASGGQLYPKETLYPSNVLYPGYYGVVKSVVASQNIPESVTQGNVTSVSLYGPSTVDYFLILDYGLTSEEATEYLNKAKTGKYDFDSYFYLGPKGPVRQDYNAGGFPDALQSGTEIQLYRKTGDSDTLEYAGKTNVGTGNVFLDYAARSQQGPYTYYMYVLSSDKYINVPSISNSVDPCFWNWTVLSCTENADGSFAVQASYHFGKNLQSGTVSNNNQPGTFKNFTPYPTVMIAPQNYQSGTLQSLIGVTKGGTYSDTIDLRDAIYNLSVTTNVLFLKNRKGDLLRIRPSDAITMETMDNTREQALTVNFPWVEVGDASDAAIYSLGGAS